MSNWAERFSEMRNTKTFWTLVVGFVIGVIVSFGIVVIFGIAFAMIGEPTPKPPKIAGQEVPSQGFQIDFSKRYNLILNLREKSGYNNCLIKGFTQAKKDSSRYGYFGTWLVVEQPDGHAIYLPPRSIQVLEEAKQ